MLNKLTTGFLANNDKTELITSMAPSQNFFRAKGSHDGSPFYWNIYSLFLKQV